MSHSFLRSLFLCAGFAVLGLNAVAETRDTILIVTGGFEETPDEFWAVAQAQKAGSTASGKIEHVMLKAEERADAAAISRAIVSRARNPRVKAIIASPAFAGTAAAFAKIGETSPDILRVAVSPQDDALRIESSSDLVLGVDAFSRGYLLARNAHQLGLSELVYVDDGENFSEEDAARFAMNLKAACDEFGIAFSAKPGGQKASDFIAERVSANGGRVLLWANTRQGATPLYQQALSGGASFIETAAPSLLSVFPYLFGYTVSRSTDDYQKVLKKAEKSIIDRGLAGHVGTWLFPAGFTLTASAIDVVQKKQLKSQKSLDISILQDAIQKVAIGTKPVLRYYDDPDTGVRARNHFLFYESVYLLGKGFLPAMAEAIPARYFQ
jgi:hypothetical protein